MTVVAKYTMPARVKLAREIEESTFNVIDYGLVFHPMTPSRDEGRCQGQVVSNGEARVGD